MVCNGRRGSLYQFLKLRIILKGISAVFNEKQKILIWDDIPAIREMGQLDEIINTLFGIVYPLKRAYKNTLQTTGKYFIIKYFNQDSEERVIFMGEKFYD